jgi:hypothetical protein
MVVSRVLVVFHYNMMGRRARCYYYSMISTPRYTTKLVFAALISL